MNPLAAATTSALALIGGAANRTLVLPLVVFFPTSRCNSRCVSCAWWTTSGDDDLTLQEIGGLTASLAALGTRVVVFSGGEPLVRDDVFDVAQLFRRRDMRLHLLTSGLALERRAVDVARHFERVVVSLDASTDGLYRDIRGVAGLTAIARGVARLKEVAPGVRVTARATLHRANFRELPGLVVTARAMKLDAISFLAADVTSEAFGPRMTGGPRGLLLSHNDVAEFRDLVETVIDRHRDAFDSGFIEERPGKLRLVPQYYAAMLGAGPFPPRSCNAPWISAVIEANGDVRPCFFHRTLGNLRQVPLPSLVRDHLRTFRSGLDVRTNRVCERCVCALNAGWRNAPWN